MDLAIETGTDYEKFGTLLLGLEDKKGDKVKNINVSERGDPVDITVEILKQWERERASYMADISDMFMSHKLKCSGR